MIMSDKSPIEWTEATWNPITGCSVVSAGCKHCYAMKLAGTRMKNEPSRAGLTIDTAAGPVWNGQVRFNEQWLDQPLRWRRPRRIFVCAHGDLFHEAVPTQWIDRIFAVMALAPQHTFQVLTKRAERMHAYLSAPDVGVRIGREESAFAKLAAFYKPKKGTANIHIGCRRYMPLSNVHLGISVENQEAADARISLLVKTPAAVRWISAEPLLAGVDISEWLFPVTACVGCPCPNPSASMSGFDDCCRDPTLGDSLLHWVVCGGESGARARPMHPEWARELRDQCAGAGVPFLFKQWGEWAPRAGRLFGSGEDFQSLDPECKRWPNLIRLGEHGLDTKIMENCTPDMGQEVFMQKVGKKTAGRMLYHVLHDGYPTQPSQ